MTDLDRQIERLEEALGEIARQADGHRTSTLYVDGQNVALANVRNIALFALGQDEDFSKRTGDWAGWEGSSSNHRDKHSSPLSEILPVASRSGGR